MKHVLCIALIAGVVTGRESRAAPLADAHLQRCLRSTVKIGSLSKKGEPVGIGSGTLIDARGYVLTNFHVVGNPLTGELTHPDGKVLAATVTSAQETATFGWVGNVVRAAPRLDLALVRIVSDRDGKPIQGAPFPHLAIGSTKNLKLGTSVWTFGYPSGVRSVNVTQGSIAGFEMNTDKQVAWLRTDAEINPGNSGGLLVDSKGTLVGVPTLVRLADGASVFESIGFARSVDRIPASWLKELSAGQLSGREIIGNFDIPVGAALKETVIGDGYTLREPERRTYRLPAQRPGKLTATVGVPMALFSSGRPGRPVRTGNGALTYAANDPGNALVMLTFDRETTGDRRVEYTLSYELQQVPTAFPIPSLVKEQLVYRVPGDKPADAAALESALRQLPYPIQFLVYDDVASWADASKAQGATDQAIDRVFERWSASGPIAGDDLFVILLAADEEELRVRAGASWPNSGVTSQVVQGIIVQAFFAAIQDEDPYAAVRHIAKAASDMRAQSGVAASSSSFSARGRLIDALTGQTLAGAVYFGRPGEKIGDKLSAAQAGKSDSPELDRTLTKVSAQGETGFVIEKLRGGTAYPAAAVVQGYRPYYFTLRESEGGTTTLGDLELMRF